MQIVIDIPEEYGIDIEDNFQDFFKRLEAEAKSHMISGTNLVCGAYELETIKMFMQALANGTPLPKGHGRLIDESKIEQIFFHKEESFYKNLKHERVIIDYTDAPTILEADKEE